MRIPDPPRHRVRFSLLHFRSQQRFQITQMTLLLLDGKFGYLHELSSDGRQLEALGILPGRRLLHRYYCSTH